MRQNRSNFSGITLWTRCLASIRGRFRRRIRLAPTIENIRADKVERIREALKAGTYNVRSEQVADKVIAHTILDATLARDVTDNTPERRMAPALSRKQRQSPLAKYYALIEFLSLGFSRHSGNVHM